MEYYLKHIKDYWFIILFVAGLIISWTAFDFRLSAVEAKQVEQAAILQQLETLNTNVFLLCVSSGVRCKNIN